jgi:hypothetical protein
MYSTKTVGLGAIASAVEEFATKTSLAKISNTNVYLNHRNY